MPARQDVKSALDTLRAKLAEVLDVGRAALRGEPGAMSEVLAEVRRRHDSAAGRPVAPERIARAVRAFRRQGAVSGFAQLRHVCLGAAAFDAGGQCLLAETTLRERLFDLAETVPGVRRQLKCFQALLRSYWSFPRYGDAGEAADAGEEALRLWLLRRRVELDMLLPRKPRWFALLGAHVNLLGDAPCERYGEALLRGDGSELQAVIDGLAIPGDSWVKQEAVLAQARAATALADADWAAVLPQLLDIAAGRAGVAISPRLAQRCIALFLVRHAHGAAVERDDDLLDAAVAAIGNPWQHRAVWDAVVLDADGKPCDLAREMVNGWLKDWLIAEFFRLHASGDDAARRTAFWLRYEPFVASLWIGLGAAEMNRSGGERERFARRASGCLLLLDAEAGEDAVLMLRFDDFLAIESAAPERDMRLYRWSRIDARLARRLGSARDAKFFSLSSLLATPQEAAAAHRDDAQGTWEDRFDELLRPRLWRGL
ncbi:MAG TPA: EH signature domain-containing protein [Rhodocyclaceae bacterium]